LRRTREEQMKLSVVYPADLEEMLAGDCSVERLFHYVKDHFEAHADQIKSKAR